MKCQKCLQNEVNVYLQFERNGQKRQVKLCSSCYQELKDYTPNMGRDTSYFSNETGSTDSSNNTCSVGQKNGEGESVLDKFGRNITQIAEKGLIDPVIGRDNEIEQLIEILNRRNKNNPVLIGEPGVGKTAVAEGLALKIVEGSVPVKLIGKKIISLDVASLTAGTSYRGQFEERLKGLVSELEENPEVILFIDEIHQLVGAGKTEGSMDAANILKPGLARGELQIIGATTLKEYREIEKDAALERRFQPIIVNEPTISDAIKILKGIAPKYEAYHNVSYPDSVLEACVQLSSRYIQDRYLPDKAIDLLDIAGAKLSLQMIGNDKETLEKRLIEIGKEKITAAEKEDYERAAKLRQEELQLEEKLTNSEETSTEVTTDVIQEIIEKQTGIPVRKLQKAEQEKLKGLQENIEQKIIGQREAVEKISRAIRRSRTGFRNENRPIASFLFLGQTGVGKTELTKVLAEELFGDRKQMIRLDMSEYMEKHSVSKLIGSPPGYVGHDEAGQLTEEVRRNSYSIILLDEMEKAHPDVQKMFLQVLEDGHLTDSKGRTVSFKDTIIIMTSNAEEMEQYFKPEFINRIDVIVKFNSLQKEDLLKIVENMLEEVIENAKKHHITILLTKEVKEKLVDLGYHQEYGARPLRRVIQEQIEDNIVDIVLDRDQVQNITFDLDTNHQIIAKCE